MQLCATPIVICRHLVLQQALKAVGLSMNQMTTRDDELNEIITVVQIQVPPQIRLARLETTNFYGDWCVTTEAALQSACSNALAYLQKAAIVTIDCIHSAELKDCQRKLLEASSWAEAFQDHAAKLQSKLDAIAIETKDSVTEVICFRSYIHMFMCGLQNILLIFLTDRTSPLLKNDASIACT